MPQITSRLMTFLDNQINLNGIMVLGFEKDFKPWANVYLTFNQRQGFEVMRPCRISKYKLYFHSSNISRKSSSLGKLQDILVWLSNRTFSGYFIALRQPLTTSLDKEKLNFVKCIWKRNLWNFSISRFFYKSSFTEGL